MIEARVWNAVALSALVAGVAGCGGSMREASTASEAASHQEPERCTDDAALPECEQRMHALQARLDRTMAGEQSLPEPGSELDHESGAAQGPDCAAAADLRDRICQLADAICALAARVDAAPSTTASCDSGRQSCTRARDEVGRACPQAGAGL